MPLTRPLVIPAWADNGDKVAPTNPEVDAGWPVTTIPPSRQRFNWAMNQMHGGVRYLARRGLSDWSDEEAYLIGDRCLAANGMTYRCILGNTNVVPGTDATRWERWGYSQSELALYLRSNLLSPTRCPATGPAANPSDASPWTMWQSVAPYNEYWMWLGDVWRVVSGAYSGASVGTNTPTANTPLNVRNFPCHRPGLVSMNMHINATSNAANQQYQTIIQINGVSSSRGMSFVPASGWLAACSASHLLRLQTGDQVDFLIQNSGTSAVNWGVGVSYVD